MNIYSGRIKELRKAMKQEGISYYMIPTADFHQSEYSADYFKEREFFSGFDDQTEHLSSDTTGQDYGQTVVTGYRPLSR